VIITATHYTPGASKWNPIDHRMFSLISATWAGEPLASYETILSNIRRTRSSKGFHWRPVRPCTPEIRPAAAVRCGSWFGRAPPG
jgi:Rhodopirellula transposase DDE domain